MLGVAAISISSATGEEQQHWKEAAQRESDRYGVAEEFVAARFEGRQAAGEIVPRRSAVDWLLVAVATAILVGFAVIARVPQFSFRWGPALALTIVSLLLLFVCGRKLWRTTGFH
jgi:hypothetical protein